MNFMRKTFRMRVVDGELGSGIDFRLAVFNSMYVAVCLLSDKNKAMLSQTEKFRLP